MMESNNILDEHDDKCTRECTVRLDRNALVLAALFKQEAVREANEKA